MRPLARPTAALVFTVAGMVALGAALVTAAWSWFSERGTLLDEAARKLLYDATLAANLLNADLLVGENTAEALSSTVGPGMAAKGLAGGLSSLALRVPGAANIYLLGPDGRVGATAYFRSAPTLEEVALLAPGSGIAFAKAPAEGGLVVALLQTLPDGSALALLYRRFMGHGPFISALSGYGGGMRIAATRPGGATLAVQDATLEPDLRPRLPDSLEASYTLPSYPLRVSMEASRRDVLATWTEATLRNGLVILVFSLVLGVLLLYGRLLRRRCREADGLAAELRLKELLYKEANHRIKNNLTMIQGILSLAASGPEGYESQADLLDSAATRIESIALLHDSLNRLPLGEDADLTDYLHHLAAMVGETEGSRPEVGFATDLEPGLRVKADVAVHCGLIVTELMTNSYKYAFPQGRAGRILVKAGRLPGHRVFVEVSDNGVGSLAAACDDEGHRRNGLGTQIVLLFAEQMEAAIENEVGEGGYRTRLSFSPEGRN